MEGWSAMHVCMPDQLLPFLLDFKLRTEASVIERSAVAVVISPLVPLTVDQVSSMSNVFKKSCGRVETRGYKAPYTYF